MTDASFANLRLVTSLPRTLASKIFSGRVFGRPRPLVFSTLSKYARQASATFSSRTAL